MSAPSSSGCTRSGVVVLSMTKIVSYSWHLSAIFLMSGSLNPGFPTLSNMTSFILLFNFSSICLKSSTSQKLLLTPNLFRVSSTSV